MAGIIPDMQGSFVAYFTKTIARRLLLALILFGCPVAYVTVSLVADQNRYIALMKRELTGTDYLRPALILHARLVDSLQNLAVQTPDARPAHAAAQSLQEMHGRQADPLDVSKQLASLHVAIEAIEKTSTYNPDHAQKILAESRGLIRSIGENSGLMIDNRLHTFYLADVAIERTAPVLENIGLYASAIAMHKQSAPATTPELVRSRSRLALLSESYSEALARAIDASLAKDNASEAARIRALELEPRARRADSTREALLQNTTPLTAPAMATDARGAVLNASLSGIELMQHDLRQRLQALERARVKVLGTVGALFIMAIGLVLFVVTNGVVRPLTRLTAAMRKVAGGDLKLSPPFIDRSDEIGDMGRALDVFRDNAVARIEAEHAAKAKSEFLAVMSHEIRTPMNGVLGMAQALSTSGLNPAQREMLKVINDSGDTLMKLLDDILDMSKIEAGKVDLEQIAFDPGLIGEHVQELFAQRAAAKGLNLKLHNQLPAESWRLGDPTRIRQIVTNLVSNALKFTDSGSISLITSIPADTGALQIAVQDTGIGIPTEQVSRLFGKFTQADSSHTRVYGGTGLGLAITKALVDAMGGTITVTSTVGEGSCFSVTLPLPVANAPPKASAASDVSLTEALENRDSDSDAAHSEGDLQVLVADDNLTNQLVLRLLLEQIGIHADFVENGKAAFDAWQGKHYDLVLMDMQMPVWDGLTAMRAIRQSEIETSRTPVAMVALTANAMPHQIAEQLAAGADAHSGKPIRMEDLIAAMETALDSAAQRSSQLTSRSMAG